MNRLRSALTPERREAGFTLAELLVYMVLLAVVVMITGVFYVHTLVLQRDTGNKAAASNSGQVTMSTMENALRNAVRVSTPSALSGRLLVMKTRIGDADTAASFVCRAWVYDPSTKKLRTKTATPAATGPFATLTATSDFSTWTPVLSNVVLSKVGGTDQQVFTAEGTTGAQILFDVTDAGGKTRVTFKSAAIPRPQGTSTGADVCF